MRAGILDNVIELYNPTYQDTGYGHKDEVYNLFYTTRANIKYNTGSRTNDNDEIFYAVNQTFTVRYYVPVTEIMRIKHDGKFYRIISIEPSKELNQKTIITELVNE